MQVDLPPCFPFFPFFFFLQLLSPSFWWILNIIHHPTREKSTYVVSMGWCDVSLDSDHNNILCSESQIEWEWLYYNSIPTREGQWQIRGSLFIATGSQETFSTGHQYYYVFQCCNAGPHAQSRVPKLDRCMEDSTVEPMRIVWLGERGRLWYDPENGSCHAGLWRGWVGILSEHYGCLAYGSTRASGFWIFVQGLTQKVIDYKHGTSWRNNSLETASPFDFFGRDRLRIYSDITDVCGGNRWHYSAGIRGQATWVLCFHQPCPCHNRLGDPIASYQTSDRKPRRLADSGWSPIGGKCSGLEPTKNRSGRLHNIRTQGYVGPSRTRFFEHTKRRSATHTTRYAAKWIRWLRAFEWHYSFCEYVGSWIFFGISSKDWCFFLWLLGMGKNWRPKPKRGYGFCRNVLLVWNCCHKIAPVALIQ